MSEPIEEFPGHHIDVEPIDELIDLLTCECGWRTAEAAIDTEISMQLHWVAKWCEAEALAELDRELDEVRKIIPGL